uniref:Uncharacterized protein n=1 Tax=Anguilla anguilla TaxID=7936 RepID=A0A0E9WG79_ANGAN
MLSCQSNHCVKCTEVNEHQMSLIVYREM